MTEFTEFGLVFHPLPGATGYWEAICPDCGMTIAGAQRANVCAYMEQHFCVPPLYRLVSPDYFSSEHVSYAEAFLRPQMGKSDGVSGEEHV